jgi:accessory gene regulator protein AgrB
MIRIAKLHSSRYGNSHTVRSVLCIIMSLLMLIIIEMLFAAWFFSQRENPYKN